MHKVLIAMTVLVASVVAVSAQEQTCTATGTTYQIGDVACITACHSQATRLARCEQKSYGATWIYLSEICPSARLHKAPGSIFGASTRVTAAMTPLPTNKPRQATPRQTVIGQTGMASAPPAI